MTSFTNTEALKAVAGSVGAGVLNSTYDFQPFSNVEQAVREDVEWLSSQEALAQPVVVSGWGMIQRLGRFIESGKY